jgi:hypothetical protein
MEVLSVATKVAVNENSMVVEDILMSMGVY